MVEMSSIQIRQACGEGRSRRRGKILCLWDIQVDMTV